MDAFTIAGFAVVAALFAFTVKQYKPELAVYIGIAGGAVVLLAAIASAEGIIDTIKGFASSWGIENDIIALIIKTIGLTYIVQVAAQLCRDMGEGALAVKTELAGKLMLLTLAVPFVSELLERIIGIVEGNL